MNDEDAITGLKRLGLTTYEARVFLALQKLGHGTASEISDVEEVPRSQVYGATEKLEERGLVETQQSTPTVYRPIPLDQARTLLLDQLARTGSETFNYLETVQDTGERTEQSEAIWLINAREGIVSRAVEIVGNAEERLLYAADDPALLEPELLDALGNATARGAATVVASADDNVLATIPEESDFTEVRVPDERDMDVSTGRLLVADGHTVLLSTLSPSGPGAGPREVAFWTSDNRFASIFVELVEAWFEQPY